MIKVALVHTPFEWNKPLTIIPHLIRKVAKVFNNHSCFFTKINGTWYVLESDIHGVRNPVIWSDWINKQTVTVYDIPNSTYVRINALGACGKVKYDFLSLFVIMPIYILTGFYIGSHLRRIQNNRLYCMEYNAWAMGHPTAFKITPQEFNEFLDQTCVKTHENISALDYLINN